MAYRTILKRGPTGTAPAPDYEGWVYLTDTRELAYAIGGRILRDVYRGGPVILTAQLGPHPSTAVRSFPNTAPREAFADRVLDEGEIAYEPGENWVYIGDGVTPGGIRAKGRA